MDLQALSLSDLYDLQDQLNDEISHRQSLERAGVMKEVRELMAKYGLSVEDLTKKGSMKASDKKPVAAKYQHPADASLTWTGRGRKPLWVQAHLDNGGSLEQLAIA